MLRRPAVVSALALGALLFVGISIMLARGLSATSAERARVFDVLVAQARGDTDEVLELLPRCADLPACVTTIRNRGESLRRPGEVEILQYRPSVQMAITDEEGTGRVAWRAGTSSPIVQCVRVLRTGAMNGAQVELISIGPALDGEAECR